MKSIGSVLAAVVLLLVGQSSASSSEGRALKDIEYDYSDGALGPANWPSLFETCGGIAQSPIDIPEPSSFVNISGSNVTEIPKFKLKYLFPEDIDSAHVKIENVNYTVLLDFRGLDIVLKAKGLEKLIQLVGRSTDLVDKFILEHIIFHWGLSNAEGSEHTIGGKAFAAEMQLVHYNANYSDISEAAQHSDGILVIAAFFEVDLDDEDDEEDDSEYERDNVLDGDDALEEIVDAVLDVNFHNVGEFFLHEVEDFLDDLSDELDTTKFYLYAGSLTIPTCEQAVTWIVIKNPLIISEDTIAAFRVLKQINSTELNAPNFRPTQDGNSRTVFDSEDQTVALAGASATESNVGKIVAGIMVPLGVVAIIGSVVAVKRRRALAKKQESEILDATKNEAGIVNAKQAAKGVSI